MGAPALSAEQIREQVKENSQFFDRLADMIPAKYYSNADTEDHIDTTWLKKSDKAAAKLLMKQNYKQNKRAKLDPDAAQTTLDIQKLKAQQQRDAAEGTAMEVDEEDEDEEEAADAPQPPLLKLGGITGAAYALAESFGCMSGFPSFGLVPSLLLILVISS